MSLHTDLDWVNRLLLEAGQSELTELQATIALSSLSGLSYQAIADETGYSLGHIKDEGAKLWSALSEVLGRRVTKKGFKAIAIKIAQAEPEVPTTESGELGIDPFEVQLEGWFETLSYEVERRLEQTERWFEFVLRVRERRGFSRVLVRGVYGEAELKDLSRLRDGVKEWRADEGWLIAVRRVSRAARAEAETLGEAGETLLCYTFDEFIDETADFTPYMEWLETEIRSKKLEKLYVPLGCKKEEVEQKTHRILAVSEYTNTERYLDTWLSDPSKGHISIMGEFGSGKTWLVLHYAWTKMKQYLDAKNRGVARPRLPLVIQLREYTKSLNVESVLANFFFTKHNIRLNSQAFYKLNVMGKLLLVFDGFDEMAMKVDYQEIVDNFWEIAKVVVPGAKAVLTCRPELFRDAETANEVLSGKVDPSFEMDRQDPPYFEVLELLKFDDDQIRNVLDKRTKSQYISEIMRNEQLLDLLRRPVMVELVLEALPEIEAGKIVDITRVYLYATRRKMERDIATKRTFTSLPDKLFFLCEVAWEMLSTNRLSLNYREFPERLLNLFGPILVKPKELDYWRYDMAGNSMLIRNASGDYMPGHRSLLEFFVAYRLAALLGALNGDLLDISKSQSYINKNLKEIDYRWSAYFQRQVDSESKVLSIPPLKTFILENMELLHRSLGTIPLTQAVFDLVIPMVTSDKNIKSKLLSILNETKVEKPNIGQYSGGNAVNLLVKLDPYVLEGKNLSNCLIVKADFTDASLRDVNFHGATIQDCNVGKFSAPVIKVEFNCDGSLLATAEGDEICLWKIEEETDISGIVQETVLKGHEDWVRTIAFSPEKQQLLASGSYDHDIRIWDAYTGECLKKLSRHQGTIRALSFSPDGQQLASSGDDGRIRLWDVSNWDNITLLNGHEHPVRSVAFIADGQYLASGSQDGTIKIWDLSRCECKKTLREHSGSILALAYSPRRRILASGGEDTSIRVWNIDNWECTSLLIGHSMPIWSITISSDGKYIISGSEDRTVRKWDVELNRCEQTLLKHNNWVRSVALNPSNSLLASGSEDKSVKVCDLNSLTCHTTLQGHTSWVWSIAFRKNRFVSATEDKVIRYWDINTGQCIKSFTGHQGSVRTTDFHPNSVLLASGCDGGDITIWNVETGKKEISLDEHSNWIRSVAFSSDGNYLASGSNDKSVKLWDIDTWKCVETFKEHDKTVRAVVFSPCSRILASVGEDKKLVLRFLRTELKPLIVSDIHDQRVSCLAFSREGGLIATGSEDNSIKIWSIRPNPDQHILFERHIHGHSSYVNSICFVGNNVIATASNDKTIKLWNIVDGRHIDSLTGHSGGVRELCFDASSGILASCSLDETVKLWDLRTGACVSTIDHRPCAGANITAVKGLTDAQRDNLLSLGAIDHSS
ncbi:MAG: NACHT domain-containing protein [Synechococcus sp.]